MALPYRKYLFVVLGSILGLLVLVAGFNALIDPLGAYRQVHLKSLDAYRGHSGERAQKAEMISQGDAEVLLLGTSRVRVGLRTDHPLLAGKSVYNLGLDGTSLAELEPVLTYALEKNPVKQVILGTDFLLFSETRDPDERFRRSRFNPRLNPMDYHAHHLLSAAIVGESVEMLQDFFRKRPPETDGRGFRRRSISPGREQRQLFKEVIENSLERPEVFGRYQYSERRMEMLKRMMQTTERKGAQLSLVILPLHALYLETIRVAGLWETYEKWQQDLVKMASAFPSVSVIDFNGYSGPVGEPVPPKGDKTTRMRYFFEASHFRPELGDLVLERIFSSNKEWGREINTTNIASHLEMIRKERAAYMQSHPQEVAWVEKIAEP